MIAGDYILVWGDADEDGFFDGELLDGRRGLVPSNFVEKLEGEELLDFHRQVRRLLCILTSERVLRTPFASQNQIFNAKTTFGILFSHKMYKIMQKITKKSYFERGSTSV